MLQLPIFKRLSVFSDKLALPELTDCSFQCKREGSGNDMGQDVLISFHICIATPTIILNLVANFDPSNFISIYRNYACHRQMDGLILSIIIVKSYWTVAQNIPSSMAPQPLPDHSFFKLLLPWPFQLVNSDHFPSQKKLYFYLFYHLK